MSEFLVTDRGEPIARITPANGRSKLEELIAAGIVQPAPRGQHRARPKPVVAAGPLSDLVTEGRR